MKVAAVGILRGVVLDALPSTKNGKESIFTSPLFLEIITPVLFRLQLPGLLDEFKDVDGKEEKGEDWIRGFVIAFAESTEPARSAENLNFYYAVLSRDVNNKVRLF